MRILPDPITFNWDKGNINKNFIKHSVTDKEAEEIFENSPKFILEDEKHSLTEIRYELFLLEICTEKKGGHMKKRFKRIPKFKNEDEERDFWATADTTEYFDWSKAEEVIFPNLRPSTESISLRLPAYLLARIKQLANFKDVPYQSLIKIFLAERVAKELKG